MSKSYRLRTQVGTDKNIRININQDFDFLEILSLKLRQDDVYTRFCADYGVVAGRVVVNGGYGAPNANVSIFIPLDQIDENDVVISTLYPYKSPTEKNEDGYRYNLLPYVKSYDGHVPTGTLPTKEDVLTRTEVLEVYEKYYKFTTKTNDSGDFMIIGVPLGIQTIVMDLDLSDMGCFSLRPSDLIRMGRATLDQVDGQNFKASEDLDSLPQIVNFTRNIDVTSFWGEEELCNIGITRTDFDLRELGIEIKPQAVFMGSMFSTSEEDFLKSNCKPKKNAGNLCDLVTSSGKILAIRQTIDYDSTGRPVLEQYNLPEGGKIIDDDGAWLVELPMNLDYVVTDEFGNQVLSSDPTIGVPTKAKYRFRVQYQNEDGMNNDIMRADYLIPNIREYGWKSGGQWSTVDLTEQMKSYAFSLDWDDYVDPQAAINCEDYFYEFNYNKIYTVANFIDRWKWGYNRSRHLGIKEITDRACTTTNNRFPVNDGVRNFDFLFFLFNILITILSPIVVILIVLSHVLALLYPILKIIIDFFIWLVNLFFDFLCWLSKRKIAGWYPFEKWNKYCSKPDIPKLSDENPFKRIALPMMSYPDCEACPCEDSDLPAETTSTQSSMSNVIQNSNISLLGDIGSAGFYTYTVCGSVLTCEGDSDSVNEKFNSFFSGIFTQSTSSCQDRIFRLPVANAPTGKFLGFDVTLAQSLNLLNVKFSYFANQANIGAYPKLGGNIITYKTTNIDPSTNNVNESNVIYDQPLIILCDEGTLSQITSDKLICFYNPENNVDPNITGLTVANQFNTNSITGTTPFNNNSLVDRPIRFIKPDGTVVNTTIKCKITTPEKQYNISAGIEYFQLITGGTISSLQSLVNNNSGPLFNYLFNKKQSLRWSFGFSTYNFIGQKPLTYFSNYENLEVLILSRGVDPYTEKQKIKYDLSSLFGYGLETGNITIEGDYYLNVPIQPNTGSGSWRQDEYTPESHNITNNTNTSLYHEPYGFQIDVTKFTAFTSNNPHYYNSTDKTQSTFRSYPADSCELKTLGDYTVGGLGYESAQPSDNTMLFEYAEPQTTEIYSTDFSSTPSGWVAQSSWDLSYNTLFDDYMKFTQNPSGTDSWAWSYGVPMVQGKSYRMRFSIENESIFGTTNKIRITVGTAQDVASQTTTVLDINNLNSTTPSIKNTNEFICPSTGTYYFGFYGYSDYTIGNSALISNLKIYESVVTLITQGRIEGGSFMASSIQSPTFYDDGYQLGNGVNTPQNQPRLYSPAYHTTNPNPITITNNNKLVFRSDRLPTSDKTQIVGNSSLSLHLNDNFNFYLVDSQGKTIVPSSQNSATDTSNNAADSQGDNPNAANDKVLETLSCEGMTVLKCYEGGGTAFTVKDPCDENPDGKRMTGGCYYLVDSPLVASIPKDIKYFIEWRSRFRLTFGACRGIFSHVFQNNWVNGSIYMFSFKKQTIFNISGQPKKYKFCGTVQSNNRPGQGPIFYTLGTTNSFFYRSAPYDGDNNNFVGQVAEENFQPVASNFKGMNDRNLFFPTTIMDLGPRDQFTSQICDNPSFQGYSVNTLKSTSFNDTADILSLYFISRLISSTFWGQAASLGDASINRMFSRSEDRLDGDITQMFSINSEYGVIPFDDDSYDDTSFYVGTGDPLLGIFFSSDTVNRRIISPGVTTFSTSPLITDYYGYPTSQVVPLYKWELKNQTTIFGTDQNDWKTSSPYYKQKYQDLNFLPPQPVSDYFNNSNTGQRGFIYNEANGIGTDIYPNGAPSNFIVGAPYHFYFGLKKGKSSLNKYITKYIGEL